MKESKIPVLPLRDIVVFPHMVVPLFVGRNKSVKALESVMKNDKKIMLITQKSAGVDDPKKDDLFDFGTVANVLQLLKLPDGTVKVLVEGLGRASINVFHENGEFLESEIDKVEENIDSNNIELIRYINNSNKQYNTKIINLGVINHVESIQTMVKSKFVVFPSLSETLGLGLVEAVNSNCHVIAAKTAFLKDIIKPSVVFDSENINELTNIVIELVEKSRKIKLKQPKVIIPNKIDQLIKLLN